MTNPVCPYGNPLGAALGIMAGISILVAAIISMPLLIVLGLILIFSAYLVALARRRRCDPPSAYANTTLNSKKGG